MQSVHNDYQNVENVVEVTLNIELRFYAICCNFTFQQKKII